MFIFSKSCLYADFCMTWFSYCFDMTCGAPSNLSTKKHSRILASALSLFEGSKVNETSADEWMSKSAHWLVWYRNQNRIARVNAATIDNQ